MNSMALSILGFIINYLVKKAEDKFMEAKSGKTKFAYVAKEVDRAIEANPMLLAEKDRLIQALPELIENSVISLINRK